MHLVNGYRRVQRNAPATIPHPFLIAPVVVEIPHNRSSVWRRLCMKRERIGFVDRVAVVTGYHVVLVRLAMPDMRDKTLPDSGRAARVKRMAPLIPTVEPAHYKNLPGIRRPDREIRTFRAIDSTLV